MQPTKLICFCLGAFAIVLAFGLEFGAQWLPLHSNVERPGVGITAMAYFDLIFLYSLALIFVDFLPVVPAVFSRVQGIVTLVLSLLALIATIVLAYFTFAFVMTMVSLLLAVPFGTIAYLAIWGDFDTASAKMVLSLAMMLKLVGVGLILFASMSFLKNKGFMLLTLCSVGLSFGLGLLHTLPPGFLVSIADAVGAVVIAIALIVWLVILLVGALFAIVAALRSVVPV
ncbi:hypothetical protein ASC89_20515 [Devosia sp. Root413D1]|uniref:hypothetical protein n=1 Tax=Devosia sp. Root413D1 TaxID=1736531 RepID=UPI0006F89DC0|nr:hypothetical protein [Devosia sp. Root413D1]KQW77554.1 hypothetical protein ASC89_20515 [Devosia sp. Root413D1]